MTPYLEGPISSDKWKDYCTCENFVHKTSVSQDRLEMVVLKRRFTPLSCRFGPSGLDSTSPILVSTGCQDTTVNLTQSSWMAIAPPIFPANKNLAHLEKS